jgi:cytochrome P450
VWLIWLLNGHPDALKRARDEVSACSPNLDALTIERIGQLDYLDACVQESMRLKPSAPFLAAEALSDTVVGDVAIAKGTTVVCLMRDTSPDNPYFDNAATFDPSRWLEDAVNRKAAMSFGAGPRICPGRYLALLEIKVAMVMLLTRSTSRPSSLNMGANHRNAWRSPCRRKHCICACGSDIKKWPGSATTGPSR